MSEKQKDIIVRGFDYIFGKTDELSDLIEKNKFKYGNKWAKILRKPNCSVTGDYWGTAMIGIPVKKNNKGCIEYAHVYAQALEMYSPEDLVEKTLCENHKRILAEMENSEHKGKIFGRNNKILRKKEVLEMLPEWEYIELRKADGIHYFSELKNTIPILSTSEYKKYL